MTDQQLANNQFIMAWIVQTVQDQMAKGTKGPLIIDTVSLKVGLPFPDEAVTTELLTVKPVKSP